MKVFVTGAGGFIGNRLAIDLAASGQLVHALVREGTPTDTLCHRNIIVHYGDILQPETMRRGMASCEQVYHVAGYARLWAGDRARFYETNVRGTENVLEQALDLGVKKLVFTSSCAVFGPSHQVPHCEADPRTIGFGNDYDLSKCLAESKVREFARRGLLAVIVNPSRVYGPGRLSISNPITAMVNRCLRGRPVFLPGCKKVTANYVYIDDVIRGHRQAMQRGISGEQYILGGENITYGDLELLIRQLFPRPRIIPVPKQIIRTASWLQLAAHHLCGSEPQFTPPAVDRYFQNMAVSSAKASRQLGYQFTPMAEGLHRILSYLVKNNHHVR